MYNWRILSFVVFVSMFWGMSLTVTFAVWMMLSSPSRHESREVEEPKSKSSGLYHTRSSSVKTESVDDFFPGPPDSEREQRERERIMKEEEDWEMEESSTIEPLVAKVGERPRRRGLGAGASTQSRLGHYEHAGAQQRQRPLNRRSY